MEIEFAGESLILLKERAILWEKKGVVFITDPHFGKDASMRSQAVPMPDILDSELGRLSELLISTSAAHLVILGDFYHDVEGLSKNQSLRITAFTDSFPRLEFTLIRGNHDLKAGDPPQSTRINCVNPPYDLGPFTLIHDPETRAAGDAHYLAGHLHPGVRLRVNRKEAVSMPAFSIAKNLIVLPAFGRLTGQGGLKTGGQKRIVAIAEDELIDLSSL